MKSFVALLVLSCAPALLVAQLVGTPPRCYSYDWDGQPLPAALAQCESFYEHVKIVNSDLTTIEFPVLTKVVRGFQVLNNSNLKTLIVPKLEAVNETVSISNNPNLGPYLDLKALAGTPGLQIHENPAVRSLSLPKLRSCKEIQIWNNALISDLYLPELTSYYTSISLVNNAELRIFVLPKLIYVEQLTFENNARLGYITVANAMEINGLTIKGNAIELVEFPKMRHGYSGYNGFHLDDDNVVSTSAFKFPSVSQCPRDKKLFSVALINVCCKEVQAFINDVMQCDTHTPDNCKMC